MPSLSELQPWLRPYAEYLVTVANYNGMHPTITSVFRSRNKQQSLYARYLRCKATGGSCIPAAPPGFSQHERRTAFDLVVRQGYRSPQQRALGEFWRAMGGLWGGEKDPVHFGLHPY